MEEKTFFSNARVRVTNARFMTEGQTYAMGNITSVKTSTTSPGAKIAVVFVFVGLLLAMSAPFVGVGVAVSAACYLGFRKPLYHIVLSTAGGETSALESRDFQYVRKVVNAINEAIVYRG